jgi:tetratricopeptide (TPR) repeat protein
LNKLSDADELKGLRCRGRNFRAFATEVVYPAIFSETENILLCKSWFQKTAHQCKNFIKKHKKSLIIATAAIVAATVVVYAVAAAPAAAAGSTALFKQEKKAYPKNLEPLEELSEVVAAVCDSSETQSLFKAQIDTFKERLILDPNLLPQDSLGAPEFSMREDSKVLGSLFAHQALPDLSHLPTGNTTEQVLFAHQVIDATFSTDYISHLGSLTHLEQNNRPPLYQLKGQQALESGYIPYAIQNFSKAIELSPHQHDLYLDRATAYLENGDYSHAMQDYQQHIDKKSPLSLQDMTDFSLGFATGLPRGLKESGSQFLSFATKCINHPIATAQEIGQAFALLAELAHSQEWATISQALAPEVCDLVNTWDNLSSKERGEQTAFAFAKMGADICAPGAVTKLISAGIKSAKEVTTVCNTLKNAEKALVLESAAQFNQIASAKELEVLSKNSGWVLPKKGGIFINNRWYT